MNSRLMNEEQIDGWMDERKQTTACLDAMQWESATLYTSQTVQSCRKLHTKCLLCCRGECASQAKTALIPHQTTGLHEPILTKDHVQCRSTPPMIADLMSLELHFMLQHIPKKAHQATQACTGLHQAAGALLVCFPKWHSAVKPVL